jgi:hypothetical protein
MPVNVSSLELYAEAIQFFKGACFPLYFRLHFSTEIGINTYFSGHKPTITSKERFYDKNEDQGPDEWTDTSMDWTRTDTSMDQGPSFRSMTKQDYLNLYGYFLHLLALIFCSAKKS